MVAERKIDESIPYGSKKHRGYTEQKHTPLLAYCVGVCLMVCLPNTTINNKHGATTTATITAATTTTTAATTTTTTTTPATATLPLAWVLRLTPLASTAACRRPGKGGCAQSGFQRYALGYAFGMLWVRILASMQVYTLWVRGIHPSTDPEAKPLSIPRSGPRKHSMLAWRSVGYAFVHVTPMLFRLIGYVLFNSHATIVHFCVFSRRWSGESALYIYIYTCFV